jgi:hypothetical protein
VGQRSTCTPVEAMGPVPAYVTGMSLLMMRADRPAGQLASAPTPCAS